MINPYLIEKNRKIEIMTLVKIVTDSSVTIEPEVVKELNITVVPLSVMIDSVLYSDADMLIVLLQERLILFKPILLVLIHC